MRVQLSSIAAIVVAFSLVGYPLIAAVNAAIGYEGRTVSIALRGLILALALTVLMQGRMRVRTRPELYRFALVSVTIGLYGARLLSEVLLHPEQLGQPASVYLLFFFGASLVPMLSVLLAQRVNIDLALRMTFAISAVATVVGFSVARQTIDVDRIGHDRGALEALNPISLGNLGVTLAVLCTWRLVTLDPQRLIPRLWLLALLATGLGLAAFAAARGPLVGLCVVMLAMLTCLRGRMRLRVCLGIAVAIAFLLVQGGDDLLIQRRFEEFLQNNDMSTSIRIDLYSASIAAIFEHPLLGISIEVPSYRYYPHNLFLEYFLATGLLAGFLIVVLVSLVLYRGFGLLREQNRHSWVFLLFLLSLTGAMFSGAIYANSAFWITTVLTLTVTRHTRCSVLPVSLEHHHLQRKPI